MSVFTRLLVPGFPRFGSGSWLALVGKQDSAWVWQVVAITLDLAACMMKCWHLATGVSKARLAAVPVGV